MIAAPDTQTKKMKKDEGEKYELLAMGKKYYTATTFFGDHPGFFCGGSVAVYRP